MDYLLLGRAVLVNLMLLLGCLAVLIHLLPSAQAEAMVEYEAPAARAELALPRCYPDFGVEYQGSHTSAIAIVFDHGWGDVEYEGAEP